MSEDYKTKFIDFCRDYSGFCSIVDSKGCLKSIQSRFLVLATGGLGGTYPHTDNYRYCAYNIHAFVELHGGRIRDLDCLFEHPFGYRNGRRILIGNESKQGEFYDNSGNFVFDSRLRQLIKDNDYHESFAEVLTSIKGATNKGAVYFYDGLRKLEIVPTVHYTAGGIVNSIDCSVVGIPGLFAIGECAADGNKNGGRLPGYAFTSAIVYGKYLAEFFSRVL